MVAGGAAVHLVNFTCRMDVFAAKCNHVISSIISIVKVSADIEKWFFKSLSDACCQQRRKRPPCPCDFYRPIAISRFELRDYFFSTFVLPYVHEFHKTVFLQAELGKKLFCYI